MSLRIYGGRASRPTRAVLWTLAMKRVPFEYHAEAIKSNPLLQRIPSDGFPAMIDGKNDFLLTQAHAILPYLADKFGWSDLYPTDLQARAMVDQWLHWQHSNLCGVARQLHGSSEEWELAGGRIFLDPNDKTGLGDVAEEAIGVMGSSSLNHGQYLAGDGLTLADICAFCEVDHLVGMGILQSTVARHPGVGRWMERMQSLPDYTAVRTVKP